jgi:hypothetical protein
MSRFGLGKGKHICTAASAYSLTDDIKQRQITSEKFRSNSQYRAMDVEGNIVAGDQHKVSIGKLVAGE